MSKGGLGKGLSALIADRPVTETLAKIPTVKTSERDSLALDVLHAGKFQPRSIFSQEELHELAESIRKNGVIQPILVRKTLEEGQYEIIAGERRWRASKMAGLLTIPAIIMDLSDNQAAEVALVENVQRQDLNMLEEAEGYQRLIVEFSYTQEKLAEVIGKSRSQIANTLRLLGLPNAVKQLLAEDKISSGHARAMISAEDPVAVAEIVVKRDLNVRQTEKLVKKLSSEPRETKSKALNAKDAEIALLEQELARQLGLELSVIKKGNQGKIVITYHSLAELDKVLRRLAYKGEEGGVIAKKPETTA